MTIALLMAVVALTAAEVGLVWYLSRQNQSAHDGHVAALNRLVHAEEVIALGEKRAADERARADEAERRRSLAEGQLQVLSREAADFKERTNQQLAAIRRDLEEKIDEAERRQLDDPAALDAAFRGVLAKAQARGTAPAAPSAAGGGDGHPRVP